MAKPWQEEYQRQEREITARHQRSKGVADGGGPPHDSDMDGRVSRLETRMDDVVDALTGVRERLARLEGKIDNLPSTWVMATTIIASQAALLGFAFALMRFVRP